MRKQQGFTLIELMVSLALGLIIIAAGTMLFLSAQQSYSLQQGGADIQDNANFGLSYIAKDIRMANLNASSTDMTSALSGGGIVLNTTNLAGINAAYVTRNAYGSSNTTQASDQLLIQYLPQETGGFDCEGQQITSTSTYVIERFFLRKDSNYSTQNETADTALGLACAAGRSTGAAITWDSSVTSGALIMKRVDYLRILLIVRDSSGNLEEVPIDQYYNIASPAASTGDIVGVRLGILARSAQAIDASSFANNNQQFNVLDQTGVSLNNTTKGLSAKYLRQVITQTVAIRNALGARQ
ncbi:prepilin-type N-terminal cleavage/methylation domain-containing protein [Acinetobacter sp.]|uniref:prepilin-type N-terminal cleavage/methylation domain-containing protein n=1 Tax=Acinetobacter sp. TaxID=472 RepID=UPI0031E29B08